MAEFCIHGNIITATVRRTLDSGETLRKFRFLRDLPKTSCVEVWDKIIVTWRPFVFFSSCSTIRSPWSGECETVEWFRKNGEEKSRFSGTSRTLVHQDWALCRIITITTFFCLFFFHSSHISLFICWRWLLRLEALRTRIKVKQSLTRLASAYQGQNSLTGLLMFIRVGFGLVPGSDISITELEVYLEKAYAAAALQPLDEKALQVLQKLSTLLWQRYQLGRVCVPISSPQLVVFQSTKHDSNHVKANSFLKRCYL